MDVVHRPSGVWRGGRGGSLRLSYFDSAAKR